MRQLTVNNAKNKSIYLQDNKYIKCVHPSPLSANNGFFNSQVFIKVE